MARHDELGYATRALKRAMQDQGFVKRLRGVKGIPDFILAFKKLKHQPIFVELKHENTNIHPLQAACLDELHAYGFLAVLLIARNDGSWDIYFPPFLDELKKIRSLKTPCRTVAKLDEKSFLN